MVWMLCAQKSNIYGSYPEGLAILIGFYLIKKTTKQPNLCCNHYIGKSYFLYYSNRPLLCTHLSVEDLASQGVLSVINVK